MKQGDEPIRQVLTQYRERNRAAARERTQWLRQQWEKLAADPNWSGWA